MSDAMKGSLVMRLRGKYPVGPEVNGEPEFGYRMFEPVAPIQNEAADVIEQLQAENEILRGLVADCIEDAGEFETDWNKKACAALNKKAIAERI